METITYETAPSRLRGKPSWLITHIAPHAHRLVAAGFTSAGARRYHYALLAALGEFGPASQATLGRRCGIDRSDVVAAINELADEKLVERTPDPEDRRRNVITITPAGLHQLQRLDSALADVQDQMLAPLSTEERKELARLLTMVLDHHAHS